MLFPVMKLLVSIWMGSCHIFKGQSLGYPVYFRLYSCCSVTQLCLTLCNSMDCSTPGFPILHYFLEFAQTYVRWVNDAIQPSHPLSPSSPLALNLAQHQGLFQWVGSLHQVAKYWSFSFSISPSNEYSGLISPESTRVDWLAWFLGCLRDSPDATYCMAKQKEDKWTPLECKMWSRAWLVVGAQKSANFRRMTTDV